MTKHDGETEPQSIKSSVTPTLLARTSISEHHTLEVVQFDGGMTGIIQTGRAVDDTPIAFEADAPPEEPEAGGTPPAGYDQSTARTSDEQQWFRTTHCNGAQFCVQAWDWAFAQSGRPVGNGSGIAMVGREGTRNANFRFLYWKNGGWIEFWNGVVVPGHWVSNGLTGNGHHIRWELNGAGADTQISLAARF
jgi:hypothetical protein